MCTMLTAYIILIKVCLLLHTLTHTSTPTHTHTHTPSLPTLTHTERGAGGAAGVAAGETLTAESGVWGAEEEDRASQTTSAAATALAHITSATLTETKTTKMAVLCTLPL